MIALSVVIPVYNEKENLPELIERVLATCRGAKREFEVIFVDDGSRDGSREILREASVVNSEIRVVVLNRNYGQHAAIFAGIEESQGDAVVTLDADLQNPPEEIPRLVDEIERGADVVGTVRQNRQDTFFRRVASSLVNNVARRATGVSMHDYGCMLRGYSRTVVNAMIRCEEHSTFIPVLANSFAGSVCEIPVKHSARISGDSKYSLFKLISLQFDLLTSISTFPLRMLSLLGGVVSMLGFGFGILLAVLRLVYGSAWAANGIFTLFAVLFIFIGAQFVGLGLLGEYIGRIYHDVRGRPRFFVKEIYGDKP
ncbi:undecaprenyl-phosphate 4-deoxy-4-formamido-L-arabinose transferase [Synergistales bacterium]|nr:undecaprenyl-phosphate 4-deoxy-4-formamido-L-arabinose transferase [Synergistales bacterium]